MLNWKKIIGVLFICGGLTEFYGVFNKAPEIKINFSPIPVELGCLTLIILGILLFRWGSKKKNI